MCVFHSSKKKGNLLWGGGKRKSPRECAQKDGDPKMAPEPPPSFPTCFASIQLSVFSSKIQFSEIYTDVLQSINRHCCQEDFLLSGSSGVRASGHLQTGSIVGWGIQRTRCAELCMTTFIQSQRAPTKVRTFNVVRKEGGGQPW